MFMWTLFRCRRTSLVPPYVRNVGGTSRLLCSFMFSGYREFSSVDAVEGCEEPKQRGRKNSFTVSYLVRTCGFSQETAKSRAKYIQFNSPEKPDSVLELLKKYGFTPHQVAKVIHSYPQILLCSADDVLTPKLEFIGSIGFLEDERTKLIASCPRILASSLHNMLMPSYIALKSLLTVAEIVQCLKRSPRLLTVDVQKHLASKHPILSRHGVPQAHIKTLLKFAPRVVSFSADKFEEIVKRVVGLGFEPTKSKFIYAVSVICQLQESNWEHKVSVYRSLGWSEDEILSTFKLFPLSMSYSEKKISTTVEFYVNKMGLTPSFLAKHPAMIAMSLEKRIIPRCSVMAILLSEGLLKKNTFSYLYILTIGEKQFMDRFVTKYCKDVPRLLSIFQEKLDSKKSGLITELAQ